MGEAFKLIMIMCATIDLVFAFRVFLGSNRKQPDNIYFVVYAIMGAIWCVCFGLIPSQTDPEIAFRLRSFGLVGTFGTFISAIFLFSCWVDTKPVFKMLFKGYGIAGLMILPSIARRDSATFVVTDFGMSYNFTPNLGNTLYNIYDVGVMLIFLFFIINLMGTRRRKREHRIGAGVLAVLIAMASGGVLDTLMPLLGYLAFPGSTIMQFVATVEVRIILFFVNRGRPTVPNVSRQLFETLNFPVLAYDNRKQLALVSEKAEEMLGLGHRIGSVVPLDDIFELNDNPLNTIQKYLVLESEILETGVRVNLEVSVMRDRFGDIDGYIVIIHDMSEHFRIMEKLNIERIKAEDASRAKTTFLANMSHEIRTPINTVLGMNEMIRRESTAENIRGYAGYIKNAGDALLSIINDILDFSKVEAGMMEIVNEKYSLRNLLIGLIEMFSLRSQEKGLDFRIVVDESLPDGLYGDEIRIRQIMINLLSNAVKYTQLGGVTFSLKKVSEEGGEVRLWFMVSDTGIGVKPEDINSLFSSFTRVDGEQTHHIEGTGLGLSIVRELTRLMNAELKVDSVYGEGSSFSFIISQKVTNTEPIGAMNDPKALLKMTVGETHKSFKAPSARLLVVDDNTMNLAVIVGLLKVTKVQLDTATSGAECLELIRNTHYDIIFLDHMMPVMDGMETFRHIREMGPEENRSWGAPVIILTANAIHGAKEQYLEAGFDGYLTKPVQSELLEDMIVKHLPESLLEADEGEESVDEQAQEQEASEEAVLRDALSAYGINLDKGLEYLKNTEIYRASAETFVLGADEFLANLKKFRDEQNVEEYRILIHGLKTNARTLGHEQLYEYALSQETACKEGRFEDVMKDGDKPETLFAAFRNGLAEALGLDSGTPDEGELAPITPEEITDKLGGILNALEDFDSDAALEIMGELRRSLIPDDLREKLDEAYRLCRGYEYDGVAAIIQEYMS